MMASTLPKGFGSFATPSVEALMALSDGEFAAARASLIPAELDADRDAPAHADSDSPPQAASGSVGARVLLPALITTPPTVADFGSAVLRRSLFCVEDEWTFINHGAQTRRP